MKEILVLCPFGVDKGLLSKAFRRRTAGADSGGGEQHCRGIRRKLHF